MGTAEYAGDANTYSKLNRRFHQHIRESALQPILAGFVDQLVYPLLMRQFRDQTRSHPRADSWASTKQSDDPVANARP